MPNATPDMFEYMFELNRGLALLKIRGDRHKAEKGINSQQLYNLSPVYFTTGHTFFFLFIGI